MQVERNICFFVGKLETKMDEMKLKGQIYIYICMCIKVISSRIILEIAGELMSLNSSGGSGDNLEN